MDRNALRYCARFRKRDLNGALIGVQASCSVEVSVKRGGNLKVAGIAAATQCRLAVGIANGLAEQYGAGHSFDGDCRQWPPLSSNTATWITCGDAVWAGIRDGTVDAAVKRNIRKRYSMVLGTRETGRILLARVASGDRAFRLIFTLHPAKWTSIWTVGNIPRVIRLSLHRKRVLRS